MQTFFGGNANNLKTVHAISARSFTELVNNLHIAYKLHLTRSEFFQMGKAERSKVKRAPYVTPATFSTSPANRRLENATTVSLLCIDVDDSAHAAPLVHSPETLALQLMPFNFLLYTTVSSTPEEPRVRIFVEADQLPVAQYRQAVQQVARMIALPSLTKESTNAVQPMFLPTVFANDPPEAHPLLFSETGGRPFTAEDLGTEDPQPYSTTTNAKNTSGDAAAALDALDYLRNPMEDVTLETVQEALEHVNPDVIYSEWLEVAAALRHQFPTEPGTTEAFNLFDEWSSKGSKYAGREETTAKWKSLRPNPRGRAPITVRSLFRQAEQGGWKGLPTVQSKLVHSFQRWLSEQDKDDFQLSSKALNKLAAIPNLTSSYIDLLLRKVSKMTTIPLPSLRKDLRERQRAAFFTATRKTPPWAKGICFVNELNSFIRPNTGERFTPETLDSNYSRELLGDSDDDEGSTKSQPVVRPRDYLLNVLQVPCAADTIYDPSKPEEVLVQTEGKTFLNTYKLTHPEADPTTSDEAGEIFVKHMKNLIAEEDYRRILMDYFAFLVQYPGQKVRWAPFLQGAPGSGKTFLCVAMERVLGTEHVRIIDTETIKSVWNEWVMNCQLIALEEVRVVGHSRHDVMNQLKPLVTNDRVSVNRRFCDQRTVVNRANYLLFSNHHDALALNEGDRRYFVLKSPIQTKKQVEALGGEQYFEKLFNMLNTKPGGLRHFFEHWPIRDTFDPNGIAPATTYLRELIQETTPDFIMKAKDLIQDKPTPMIQEDLISVNALLAELEMQGVTNHAPSHLTTALTESGYHRVGRTRIGTERHSLWVPAGSGLSLTDARDLALERMHADLL